MHTNITTLSKWLRIAPGLSECAHRSYESKPHLVCPIQGRVFRALELLAPENVRTVILGQDPYHTPGKASGIAFGYHPEYIGRLDSSLLNILRELDIEQSFWNSHSQTRLQFLTLEEWVAQGVLLLNTRLTVQIGTPMSHADKGWEMEIGRVLQHLDQLYGSKLVWLNWGREARRICPVPEGAPNRIDSTHPCKFSHTHAPNPFTGSRCFDRANDYLIDHQMAPINWKGLYK